MAPQRYTRVDTGIYLGIYKGINRALDFVRFLLNGDQRRWYKDQCGIIESAKAFQYFRRKEEAVGDNQNK